MRRTVVQHPAMVANQLERHLDLIVAVLFQGVPDVVDLPAGHLALELVHELWVDDAEVVRVGPAPLSRLALRVERRLGAIRPSALLEVDAVERVVASDERGQVADWRAVFTRWRERHRLEVSRQTRLKPRQLPDLGNRDPLDWVDDEHLREQVLGVGRQPRWQVVDAAVDLLEERRNVVVVKRQPAAEHDVEDDTAAPDVDLGAGIQSAKRRKAGSRRSAPATALLAQATVSGATYFPLMTSGAA